MLKSTALSAYAWDFPRISSDQLLKFKVTFALCQRLPKVNELRYKQCRVTPHFFNVFIDFKIYWKTYWEKINIYIINWEKIFDRSADRK